MVREGLTEKAESEELRVNKGMEEKHHEVRLYTAGLGPPSAGHNGTEWGGEQERQI